MLSEKDKEMHMKALSGMIHAMGKASVEPFKEKLPEHGVIAIKEIHKEIPVKALMSGAHPEHEETGPEEEHPEVKSPIELAMDHTHEETPEEEHVEPEEDKMFKPSWMKNKKR